MPFYHREHRKTQRKRNTFLPPRAPKTPRREKLPLVPQGKEEKNSLELILSL